MQKCLHQHMNSFIVRFEACHQHMKDEKTVENHYSWGEKIKIKFSKMKVCIILPLFFMISFNISLDYLDCKKVFCARRWDHVFLSNNNKNDNKIII